MRSSSCSPGGHSCLTGTRGPVTGPPSVQGGRALRYTAIFGSHRKPEAVAIPYELFEALLPAIEDVLLAATIRERSGQSEVPWEEALEQLGITQQQVDSVDLGEYVIEGR
jgi:hypothetical protein